jgi:nitrogen fixation/metabolism regulation signal transduction histidine kinase
MTMTPVAVRSQNKTLMVAATTYIDEFSIPVRTMNKKSEEANTKYKDFIANQVVIIGSVMTTILILTLIAVYLLSKHAARRYIYPIVHLAGVVEGFGGGDLDIEATVINQREDELGALARSFSRMR